MTRGGLANHLKKCAKRQEAINTADRTVTDRKQKLYHLQIQDAWSSAFWLHIEVNGTASLQDLDEYLRAIWLECCGHLSQFSVGKGWRDEVPMSRKIEHVFQPGVEIVTHIVVRQARSRTSASGRRVRGADAAHQLASLWHVWLRWPRRATLLAIP